MQFLLQQQVLLYLQCLENCVIIMSNYLNFKPNDFKNQSMVVQKIISFQFCRLSIVNYNLLTIPLMIQTNRHTQNIDVIYQDVEEMTDSFQVPEQDTYTKKMFQKAQEQQKHNASIKQQTKDMLEDEEEEVTFVFTNLDTGESNLINIKQTAELERSCSFKKKQIRMKEEEGAWYDFWKKVHRNNEELRAACERGDLNYVKMIVSRKESDYPIDINSKGLDNWTALHFAAYDDNNVIVEYLIENGANINASARFGKTALHITALRGNLQTVASLVMKGIDMNAQDEEGNTALHIAAENGYERIVEYLVNSNAILLRNKNGQSPLDVVSKGAVGDRIKQVFEKNNLKVSNSQVRFSESGDLSPTKQIKKALDTTNKIVKTPLEQLALTTDSFIYYKMLGKGSFGEVFLVKRKGDEQLYAMKVLSKQKIFGKNLIRYAMTERNVLSAMNHPFIVKLHYTFQNETKLFLVMEYCPGGDLGKMLVKKKMLTEQQTRMYLCELILAFQALHKNMIVFRDLKPDNVVLDADGHVKLTDFGLSKQGVYNNSTQSFCGSVAYLAPQILTKQGHSRTVDWYLLGLLAYQLMVGVPPYYNSKKEVLFENIKRGPLKIPKSMSQQAKDLIKRLLSRDPSKRLGSERDASEVRQHPFFQGVDWLQVMNRSLPVQKAEVPKINLNDTIKVSFDEKSDSKGKRIDQWTFINNI